MANAANMRNQQMSENMMKMTVAEELTAWNQWKRVCHVNGCDDKEKKYLRSRVVSKLSRELRKCGVDLASDSRLNADDLVSEFDMYLVCKKTTAKQETESEKSQEEVKSQPHFKEYKDHVWRKVAGSDDPPMKVINGMLLGDRSVAMEVVRNIMRKYFGAQTARVVQEVSGQIVRRQVMPRSLHNDEDTQRPGQKSWEEMLADTILPKPDEMAMQNKRELANSMRNILETLSLAEKIVLLADLRQVSISDKIVCNALHCGKSTACALAKQVREKLARWRNQSLDAPRVMTLEVYEVLCEMITTELVQSQKPEIRHFLRQVECLTSFAEIALS